MTLTNEELDQLEDLAGAFMKKSEICLIMGIKEDEFEKALSDHGSEIYISYTKGYLQSKFEVNRKIIDLAKAGSSPAQTMANRLILDKELENG